jgi:hypothetical protein
LNAAGRCYFQIGFLPIRREVCVAQGTGSMCFRQRRPYLRQGHEIAASQARPWWWAQSSASGQRWTRGAPAPQTPRATPVPPSDRAPRRTPCPRDRPGCRRPARVVRLASPVRRRLAFGSDRSRAASMLQCVRPEETSTIQSQACPSSSARRSAVAHDASDDQ